MAKRTVTAVVCDRDGFGKQRKATQRRQACYEGTWFEWFLCEEHAVQWDREMFAWSRLGKEIDAPLLAAHPKSASPVHSADYVERARRAAELRARQEPRPLNVVRHDHHAQPEDDVLVPREPAIGERWPNGWVVTPHADERAQQRHYTSQEMLAAAASPEVSYQDTRAGQKDVWIHQRGECAVAVNPREKVIITVLHRDEAKYAAEFHHHTNGRIAQ